MSDGSEVNGDGTDAATSEPCPVCGGTVTGDARGHVRVADHIRTECPATPGSGDGDGA